MKDMVGGCDRLCECHGSVQVVVTEHTCVSYGLWITGVSMIVGWFTPYCYHPDSKGGIGSRLVQLQSVRSCV